METKPVDTVVPAGGGNPEEVHLSLSNGLSVYLIRDTRFPLVCTRLYVRTGSTREVPEQFGISHVLEHMVFKGTASRPKGQVARDVETLGGYLNAYTSFDKTCYLTDMPSRHWKMGIDVVRDMAFHPSLDPGELESEKPVIVSELEGYEDNPSRRLHELLQGATLAGTPYAHPIIGTRDTVRSVTGESLRAYIDRWYQPQNMLLVVAGDIDLKEVRAYVEETFGGLRGSNVLPGLRPVDIEEAGRGAPRVEKLEASVNKVYLGLSFPVPGLRDSQSLDLDILSYLMAGDGTSWLQRKYRLERRLVDSISVSNMSFNRVGMFTVMAVLDADKVETFFGELLADLGGLDMARFSEGELDRAKFNLEDSMNRSSETLNGLASWRALMEFELGGRQGESNMRNSLKNVTFEQMAATWKRWFRPEAVRVRVLSPEKARLPDLEAMMDRALPVVTTASVASSAARAGASEELDLGHGRTLVLLPDRTVPYISLSLMLPGGNALLRSADAGLATLTAALLGDGCGDMDRLAFERYLAERAASIDVSAGKQSFSCTATGPGRFAEDLCGLVKTMLERPAFDATELAREASDIKAAIASRADSPMGLLSSKLSPFLFGSHPYGMDMLGSPGNMDRFGREDVLRYWERQRTQPWALAVAGDFDREKIVAWARSLPIPSEHGVTVEAPVLGSEKTLDITMERNQAHLVLVYPAVPRTHPDAPALILLREILTGQSGLLFSQLRDDEGLGYTVTAQTLFHPACGQFLFYIGTKPEKLGQAREGFARVIEGLRTNLLSKDMLEAGCNRAEGAYYRFRQSLSSRCGEAVMAEFLGVPQDFERRLLDRMRKLAPEDLLAAARKYLVGPYEVSLHP